MAGNWLSGFLSSFRHDDSLSHQHHDHGHGRDHDGWDSAAVPAPHPFASTTLSGWLAGQIRTTATPDETDGGTKYSLSGKAHLAGLDEVTVDGFVQGTGFIAQGHATGQLVLTKIGDAGSTLTVNLRGPLQGGLAPLPSAWTVHFGHGTGAFAHIHGHETLTLNIAMSNTVPDHGTFHGSM
jgi:hypothetical protein